MVRNRAELKKKTIYYKEKTVSTLIEVFILEEVIKSSDSYE
jgi:hypothetical protein